MDSPAAKVCKKCLIEKPLEGFYQDRSREDGRRNSCIECDKIRKRLPEVRERNNRWGRSAKGNAAYRRYRKTAKGKAAMKRRSKKISADPALRARASEFTKKYQRTPHGKAKVAAYQSAPDYAERKRRSGKARRARPEVRAKMNAKAVIVVAARQALKNALPSTFTPGDWIRCQWHFGFACAYCGEFAPLTQDHFIPVTSGGPYTPENIVPACRACNTRKLNKDPKKWCPPEVYDRVQDYFASLARQ